MQLSTSTPQLSSRSRLHKTKGGPRHSPLCTHKMREHGFPNFCLKPNGNVLFVKKGKRKKSESSPFKSFPNKGRSDVAESCAKKGEVSRKGPEKMTPDREEEIEKAALQIRGNGNQISRGCPSTLADLPPGPPPP